VESTDDVVALCECIATIGKSSLDGTESVRFGELVEQEQIFSYNLEEVLRLAKECRLVQFHGDTLDRGKDASLVIRLARRNREIQHYYHDTGHLLPNSAAGNLWLDTDCARRKHYSWVTNVREVTRVRISYCVQCDLAEWDDAQELPKRCFPLTKDKVVEHAVVVIHQKTVRTLGKATQASKQSVLSFGEDYYEPCVEAHAEPIDNIEIANVDEIIESKNLEAPEVQTVKILHCSIITLTQKVKIPYEEVYIRPLMRLYPKDHYTQLSNRSQRAKTEKPVIHADAPTPTRSQAPRTQASEKILTQYQYSPSYSKHSYSRTNQYRTAYLTTSSRARSEFREKRSYFSLYH